MFTNYPSIAADAKKKEGGQGHKAMFWSPETKYNVLRRKAGRSLREDALNVDLFICTGTSMKVAPCSDFLSVIPKHCPQILINNESVQTRKHLSEGFDQNYLEIVTQSPSLLRTN